MWNKVWEEIFRGREWGKYPAEPLIRFMMRNFGASEREAVRVLELGSGPGANLWYLAREGFSFVGIDGSPAAVEQAYARLDAECPGWRHRGEIRVGDVTASALAESSFDAVIDNECVYCLPFDAARQVYSEVRRALKPGGRLFVRTFAPETWGFGSGKLIDDFMFECEEGPLAQKGASRFTTCDQISALLDGYFEVQVEKTQTTLMGGEKLVAEWLIEAVK